MSSSAPLEAESSIRSAGGIKLPRKPTPARPRATVFGCQDAVLFLERSQLQRASSRLPTSATYARLVPLIQARLQTKCSSVRDPLPRTATRTSKELSNEHIWITLSTVEIANNNSVNPSHGSPGNAYPPPWRPPWGSIRASIKTRRRAGGVWRLPSLRVTGEGTGYPNELENVLESAASWPNPGGREGPGILPAELICPRWPAAHGTGLEGSWRR